MSSLRLLVLSAERSGLPSETDTALCPVNKEKICLEILLLLLCITVIICFSMLSFLGKRCAQSRYFWHWYLSCTKPINFNWALTTALQSRAISCTSKFLWQEMRQIKELIRSKQPEEKRFNAFSHHHPFRERKNASTSCIQKQTFNNSFLFLHYNSIYDP